MSDLKIRGEFPDYVIKSLQRDQHGIFAGVVEVQHEVGAKNQRIDLDWLSFVSAPNPWNIPCVSSGAEVENGVCVVTFGYQGAETTSADEVTFELDASMSSERIETHPSFPTLKKLYGWSSSDRMFAEFLTSSAASGGARSVGKSEGKENPLFGTTDWLQVGVTYRRTYASTTIPSSLFSSIGTIVKTPPGVGRFKLPASTRNWLELGPKVSQVGSAARISQEWLLSAPGGWLVPVYSKSQLKL